jgi:RNA polymerase sigma-70 factor (ECF subfamily)
VQVDEQLAAFCEREHTRVLGVLTLYVGDVHLAEELAQDALVRLCKHWPRVRAMDRPEAWLTTVAMNLARSMFRRRYAARRAYARHGPEAGSQQHEHADVLAVREAVAALPRRTREAVIYRWFLGHSVRETAQALNCAEGTVRSLTSRGLSTLREKGLVDAGEDDQNATRRAADANR